MKPELPENELLAGQMSTQEFFDIVGVMILTLDDLGKVTQINKKGCEILEYEEEDIIGKDWFENFLPKREKNDVKVIFKKLMAGEVEPFEHVEDFSVLSRSGEEKIIAWNNVLLRNHNGEIKGTLRACPTNTPAAAYAGIR